MSEFTITDGTPSADHADSEPLLIISGSDSKLPENPYVEPPEVDPYEQLTLQFNTLSAKFKTELDPSMQVKLSSELRGLFDEIRNTDFNVVKQKRAMHKLGALIRQYELDTSIPAELKDRLLTDLKGVIK